MSTTENIRRHVAAALPGTEVRKPAKGVRGGIEVVLDDGTVLTWRLVPGDPWEGHAILPDGDIEDLPSVPKGLLVAQTAEILVDLIQRRQSAAAA